jgi:Na+/H+-dicarboxylate symporter
VGETATNILGNAVATAVLGRNHEKATRPGNQKPADAADPLEEAELTPAR